MTRELQTHVAGDNVVAEALETEIADVYAGPLEAFVTRRGELAKRLRAAGRREDAKMVKTLRKPKRLAWALNVASRTEPEAIDSVEVAIAAVLDAQSGAGDFRTALSAVRAAADDLAAAASRVAARSGHSVENWELTNAVIAVIGTQDAFALLRAGRLVEVPDAGGLDLLAAPPATAGASNDVGVTASAAEASSKAASREVLLEAERSLAAVRERLATAERALGEAKSNAERAERALVLAQREVHARRADVDRARVEVKTAAAQVQEAEEAVAKARQATTSG